MEKYTIKEKIAIYESFEKMLDDTRPLVLGSGESDCKNKMIKYRAKVRTALAELKQQIKNHKVEDEGTGLDFIHWGLCAGMMFFMITTILLLN